MIVSKETVCCTTLSGQAIAFASQCSLKKEPGQFKAAKVHASFFRFYYKTVL